MEYHHSQDTRSSAISSSPPRRIVRSLVIDSFTNPPTQDDQGQDQGSTTSTLYCRVVIPSPYSTTSSSSTKHVLIDSFLSTTSLKNSKVYELPLINQLEEETEEEELKKALEYLEIPLLSSDYQGDDDDGEEERSRPAIRRRRSTVTRLCKPRLRNKRRRGKISVLEENDKVYLNYEGREEGEEVTGDIQEGEEEKEEEEMVELIVVLQLETRFGIFREPKYPNIVTLPIPQCLRNTLRLTLPQPPSSTSRSSNGGSWDLKINPSLSNVQSFPTTSTSSGGSSTSTLITGSFPSCSIVSIRYTKQQQQEQQSSPSPRFSIPSSEITTDWNIIEHERKEDEKEGGILQVELGIKGEWECKGLKEKHWIELKVATEGGRDSLGEGGVQVENVRGGGILGWEIIVNKNNSILSSVGAADTSDENILKSSINEGNHQRQDEQIKGSSSFCKNQNSDQRPDSLPLPTPSSSPSPTPTPTPTPHSTTSQSSTIRRKYSSTSLKYTSSSSSSSSSRLTPKWNTSLFDTKPPPLTSLSTIPVPPLLDSSSSSSSTFNNSLPVFTHARSSRDSSGSSSSVAGRTITDIDAGGGRGIIMLSQEKAPFNDPNDETSKLEEEDSSFDLNAHQLAQGKGKEEGGVVDQKRESEESLLLNERLEPEEEEEEEEEEGEELIKDESVLFGVEAEESLLPIEQGHQKIESGEEEEQEEKEEMINSILPQQLNEKDDTSSSTTLIRIQISLSSLILQHLSSSSTTSLTKQTPQFSFRLKLAFPNFLQQQSLPLLLLQQDNLVSSPSSSTTTLEQEVSKEDRFLKRLSRLSLLPSFSIANSQRDRLKVPVPEFLDTNDNNNHNKNEKDEDKSDENEHGPTEDRLRNGGMTEFNQNDSRGLGGGNNLEIRTGDSEVVDNATDGIERPREESLHKLNGIKRYRAKDREQTESPSLTTTTSGKIDQYVPTSLDHIPPPSLPPPPNNTAPQSTMMISHFSVEITPISPTLSITSDDDDDNQDQWRIFYRFEINKNYSGKQQGIQSFTIPHSNDSTTEGRRRNSRVKIHNVWGIDGRCIDFKSVHVAGGEGEEEGMKISTNAIGGIREVLYEERKSGEGEDIEGAALLPFLNQGVAKYQVEVFEAQGYDLNVVIHDFDLSTKKLKDSSKRLFTKFLVPSNTRPFLPLRFRPITHTTPTPLTSTTTSLRSPTTRGNPSKLTIFPKTNTFKDLVNLTSLIALIFLIISVPLSRFFDNSSPPSPSSSITILQPVKSSSSFPTPTTYLPPPPISYSTVTKTTTITHPASTITSIKTMTEYRNSPPPPLATTKFLSPMDNDDDDDDDDYVKEDEEEIQAKFEISDDGSNGNPILIWLEKLRIGWKEIFENLWNTLSSSGGKTWR